MACSLAMLHASCTWNPTEKELNESDLEFIRSLGILNTGEKIELFDCNSGFKGIEQSGNFISDKRIACYWIEDGIKEIHSALFANEIDSLALNDLSTSLTYSSSIKVYKRDKSSFEIYVDGDSTRVRLFYNRAQDNLLKFRISR